VLRLTHCICFFLYVNLYGSSSCPLAKTDWQRVILKSIFYKGWKISQTAASLPHLNSNNQLFFVKVTACFMWAITSIFNAAQMNSMLHDVGSCSSVTCTIIQCNQKELTIFQADYLSYFETYYHGVLCQMFSNSHRSFGPWLLHVCDQVHLTVSVAVTLYVQHSQYNSVCLSPVTSNKAQSYKGTYLRRSSFSW
jgi:hypothetical protein